MRAAGNRAAAFTAACAQHVRVPTVNCSQPSRNSVRLEIVGKWSAARKPPALELALEMVEAIVRDGEDVCEDLGGRKEPTKGLVSSRGKGIAWVMKRKACKSRCGESGSRGGHAQWTRREAADKSSLVERTRRGGSGLSCPSNFIPPMSLSAGPTSQSTFSTLVRASSACQLLTPVRSFQSDLLFSTTHALPALAHLIPASFNFRLPTTDRLAWNFTARSSPPAADCCSAAT